MTSLKKYINVASPMKKRGSLAPPVLSAKTLFKVREDNSDLFKINELAEVNASIAKVKNGIGKSLKKIPSFNKLPSG
jgi:hypothetical protein